MPEMSTSPLTASKFAWGAPLTSTAWMGSFCGCRKRTRNFAGAAVGTVLGGVKARQNQSAQNQQAQQQQQQALNKYYRAYAACMEGRGYSVK